MDGQKMLADIVGLVAFLRRKRPALIRRSDFGCKQAGSRAHSCGSNATPLQLILAGVSGSTYI